MGLFGSIIGLVTNPIGTIADALVSRIIPGKQPTGISQQIPGRLGPPTFGFAGAGGTSSCPPGTPGCPTPCPPNTVPDPQGRGFCVSRKSPLGIGAGAAADFGAAVLGQFGSGLEPAVRTTNTRICPRGAVLGSDGICYNRREIRNTDRAWPRGRRPLLTGGEMRAISIASRAAKKLATKEKQLRSMGMLKALPRRAAQRALPAGHHAHAAHD